ncbi:DUF805 domain-containing protein [Roseovarius sp. SCSIO 43702]|uniref:DUF805 domain-containing protein n=1 Tax=Roseovarius sp. SCSIO 43702 TaxID=2823043 RepID=UPI001C732D9E|nr:DUF805 domain-containing protein [Roseovarius sp. SCSIO 43702]QYX55714.1 DUF805 domain-containing protein [Roseovarius sp. SCSIO 43702]
MGFKEALDTCLRRKYATFQGRAARSEYWVFYLFQVAGIALFGSLAYYTFYANPSTLVLDFGNWPVLTWLTLAPLVLFILATLLPAISVTVRRLHDRNLSGWWYLVYIITGAIPFIERIAVLVFFFVTVMKGTEGENKYGPDPLAGPNTADVFA